MQLYIQTLQKLLVKLLYLHYFNLTNYSTKLTPSHECKVKQVKSPTVTEEISDETGYFLFIEQKHSSTRDFLNSKNNNRFPTFLKKLYECPC